MHDNRVETAFLGQLARDAKVARSNGKASLHLALAAFRGNELREILSVYCGNDAAELAPKLTKASLVYIEGVLIQTTPRSVHLNASYLRLVGGPAPRSRKIEGGLFVFVTDTVAMEAA